MASVPKPNVTGERQDLYRRMDKHNLAPLWEVLGALVPTAAVAALRAGAVAVPRCASPT